MRKTTILGVYTSGGRAAGAIAAIRRDQLGAVETYSPTADHAIVGTGSPPASPVRLFTLIGGTLGCALGVGLPVYTMVDWPLIVGGKPLISIPPLVVIAFELTMLFAGLSTFIGFLLLAGLPRIRRPSSYDERFTDDRFGVLVTCTREHLDAVRGHLEQAGAAEVRHGA